MAMAELHIVNYPLYHHCSVKPRNFDDFCDMISGDGKGIKGIWEWVQWDGKSGLVLARIWNVNVVTDSGADKILKRAINSASATLPNLFNQVAITDNSGSTSLTTALSNGQTGITSLAVAALPASIPSGTVLTLGYGTGQNQQVTTSALANAGATSISVQSFTANAAYGIGTAVVPNPVVTDDPSSLSGVHVSYSGALLTGAFTYIPTTGAGNRQVVVTAVFQNSGGTNTPVGNYTDAWIVNTNPVSGVGQTADHVINTPMRCDASNNVTTNNTVKI
jgi:hypothetical protein